MDYAQFGNNVIAKLEQDETTFVRWVKKGEFVVLECLCVVAGVTTYKEVPLVPKPKYTPRDFPMGQVGVPSLIR